MSNKADSGSGASATRFSGIDYVKITIFGFALAALWGSLHSVVLQIRLLDFVAESQKNTYLGLLTFTGLILAMAVQPIAGTISDRSRFSWGRRRPFVLMGTIAAMLFLFGIGSFGSYAALFAMYCLLQVSTNTAQAPYQGFIPDLVPEGKRGTASGVKSFLEILGGVALLWVISRFMDRYFASGESPWLLLSLGVLAAILLGAMLVTVLTVKERPGGGGVKLSLSSALRQSFKIDVRANRAFILFLVSRLLIFMAMTTLQTFALYFLMDVVGVASPAAVAADLLIAAGVCMMIVVYPAGRLSDRVGRKPIVAASGFIGAAGVILLFLSHTYISILISGGIMGIAFGAFLSTNWALATDLVAKDEEARYLGLANVATAGGAALARLIGPAIDFFNSYGPGLGYQIMLLACFIYFILGSLLVMRIRTPR
jgi:Na+/melibiose symporter-like transporter